ncbi:MAG TPA: NAD-dependent succinate-semialdehyde dehydrogenase [Phenylobacterium sp.]|uniref:NAD-dependent succinate-semialdehyde dehydrogenase n=1 Tax=Phenylobacterium sp. TaxID=1871053 RepID=UPI002B4A8816|nr:NAD-dependent succinate-semialdehyde dehydrogenase [Phenylobacterium sp.]HKR89686.1 NAD-dependent succinate-semialdehyde dehydrogenase [Phenylobacterium sp.]
MTSYCDTELFIDGAWGAAAAGATIDVVNPATGARIGGLAKAGIADLDRALAAADRGYRIWRATAAFERARIMRRAAELMRERADVIASILTQEQGKPLAEAKGEAMASGDIIEWFAEEGRRAYGRIVPARTPSVQQLVIKEPVGPVAAFTPWNFPINQAVRKIAAALAAGCSIIVKGPEETPASCAELVRAFADAGVPAGVVNLVFGVPAEISDYLIGHPVIRKISFTGSTTVGKQLAALAGEHMKRVTMELGGHAPVMVFEDADIGAAAKAMAMSKIRNAGQVCISPTRFLVQNDAFDPFVAAFVETIGKVKVGDGMESGTQMGPLANERRIPAIEALIVDAVERGGKLLAGGARIGNRGNFFEPSVLVDVPIEARIMNEEPFGPVAVINRFSTTKEAIAEANRLPYGLAAYAFTESASTMHALGDQVEAGMITINHLGLALPELPFGGVRDSGYGTEGGADALEPYLVAKLVTRSYA